MGRPRRTMHLATVVDEARRDVASGTTRALLLGVVFGTAMTATIALALGDAVRVIADGQRFRDSGASTMVLTAEGRIAGDACDQLRSLPSARAAGAVRAAPSDTVASALVSNPIPSKEITPGFRGLIGAPVSGSRSGLLVSEDVARTLSIATGDPLPTATSSASVEGIFAVPDDGRQGDLSFSLLLPQTTGDTRPYDQCWVEFWPPDPASAALLRTSLVAAGDDSDRPTLRALNTRLGREFDGSSELAAGLGARAPLIALVTGGALGWAAVRRRRLELASALHAGVARPALALGQALQAIVWITAGSALAAPTLVALGTGSGRANAAALLAWGGVCLVTGALAAVSGTLFAVLATRERHLFRYFKDR